MIDSVRFQTRARTVDHLGREQIADCPTAISELWKNSYDAYSRSASLHIFDGDPVVACICDDGHGMSREEFINKWLVIGTDSKVLWSETSSSDRNGLKSRKRQGKKGIGRLSAGYLANLLLLVSKRESGDFVASLIDWRIFENPFLVLEDIKIPITTFQEKSQLFEEVPRLYDRLMDNIWGEKGNEDHQDRITSAWKSYDELERSRIKKDEVARPTTRELIELTLLSEAFSERHISEWEVWDSVNGHGTAMLMAGVIPELEIQLEGNAKSMSDSKAKENFRDTLWCFIDPFNAISESNSEIGIVEFNTRVIGWKADKRIPIIEESAGFQPQAVGTFEHIIDGDVDESGVFRGRVKAFGKWLSEEIEIKPNERPPSRTDTRVGEFSFYAATMEGTRSNSTHSEQEFTVLSKLLSQFSGLMVFRDGFRVMPYGRTDADYFEVEPRRGGNAGREFWVHRKMLGRVAISDFNNPNLKDKAGREGIIDGRASQAFRALVVNILMTSARRFFGSASDIRKNTLPTLNEAYSKKKREEQNAKLLAKKRRQFRTNLVSNGPNLEKLADEFDLIRESLDHPGTLEDLDKVVNLQKNLSNLKQRRVELRLGAAPEKLSPKLKVVYTDYREKLQRIESIAKEVEESISNSFELLAPRDPSEIARNEVESQVRYIKKRLNSWEKRHGSLLESERSRVSDFCKNRYQEINSHLSEIISDLKNEKLSLTEALSLIEKVSEQSDQDNESQLQGIISALESMGENIDLDLLANHNSEEAGKLRADIDRLVSLAQLGITVEIIDHELGSLSSTVSHGLSRFPEPIITSAPYRQVNDAYHSLEERLKFLSPLKLSGSPQHRHITGAEIVEYVRSFFRADLLENVFSIRSTPSFDAFSVYDLPARILPVFINLANNSRYWIQQNSSSEKVVLFSTVGSKVVVSDSGPGVDSEDQQSLFGLFFSNRQGGRGVGLYLCRANLAAGGHKISYAAEGALQLLSGANFVIDFREASFPL